MERVPSTMRGYGRGGPYRVSDTPRIRIRLGYAADTYPYRTTKFGYVSCWIRVSDTFGLIWIRPMNENGPILTLPNVTYCLPKPPRTLASHRIVERRRIASHSRLLHFHFDSSLGGAAAAAIGRRWPGCASSCRRAGDALSEISSPSGDLHPCTCTSSRSPTSRWCRI